MWAASMLAVGALCAPVQEGAAPIDLPELRLEDLARWKARIWPAQKERAWETIPWLPSFGEGVRAAGLERRPLLFWAMNGHPLGCT